MAGILNTCYETTSASHAIAYYSHIVPIAVLLVVGGFVLFQSAEKRLKSIFALFITTFSLWLIGDLITWVISDYYTVYAFWSTLDFLEVAFFILGAYFSASFIYPHQMPVFLRFFFPIVLFIPFIITITGNSTFEFNHSVCESLESGFLTNYRFYSEMAILALLVYLGFRVSRLSVSHKGPLYAIITSLLLFLGTFSLSSYLASLTYYYEFLFYGLLTLPIFFIILVYSITNFELFRVRAFGVQVLIYLILILVSAQYLFITLTINKILTGITLILTAVFGYLFQQSAIREIEQRERIEKLAKELEVSNEQLSEFMSLATHEIRNPATFIKGFTAGALDGDLGELTPVIRDGMQKIFIRINDIIHLGNQYLDKSKLELNQLKYEFVSLDLGKLVEDLVHEFQPAPTQYGIMITSVIDKAGDYTVQADSGKIKEVLGNLIDNAIKYTPKGSVTVSVLKGNGTVQVKIADTGVGIPAETIPQLFKKFSRADAQKVNLLGTGLGLYLAKIFIDAHHGKILVESPGKGKGATFVVELPVK